MQLKNEFTVAASVEQTWRTLIDIERVARCLPGAVLEPGSDDGLFRGAMKMRLGPVTVDYQGTARLLEVDEAMHVAVLKADAREARGQGTATATITNRLAGEGDLTRVAVVTDLKIVGRQAQFGRAIMQDVAQRMLGEFASHLEREILLGVTTEKPPGALASPTPEAVDEVLDLGPVVSGMVLRRAVPAAGAAIIVLGLLRRIARRRSRPGFSLVVELR